MPPWHAWLLASAAAGGTVGVAGSFWEAKSAVGSWGARLVEVPLMVLGSGAFYGLCIAMFTAPVISMVVLLMRQFKAPRGWTDAGAGGLVGLIEAWVLLGGMGFDIRALPPIVAPFMLAGIVGGFTYWRVAGRPRPPYALGAT